MDPASLFDASSAAIVIGGTALATFLRSGWRDCRLTFRALARLGAARFDADAVRAELAVQIREIRQDGLVRAHPHLFGDREFDEATGALIETRSIDALLARHEAHKARRLALEGAASRTLAQAAELAPVFGLAGTLVSLSQLPADGIARGAFAGAISMAVLTTLYGLLLANLVLAPLARAIDRRIAAEEAERQKLFDWLAEQVAPVIPHRRAGQVPGQAAGLGEAA
jgi:chemotaxis protein MotA